MAQANFQPTWALIKRPHNYPTGPAVGKPELIFRANEKSLYHRLSPYTDYDMGLFGKLLGDSEPFYYIYPDQANKFPNSAKKYESSLFPLGSGIIDVIRVGKFLASGRGITFMAKQFLLQTGNPYNETRIYNPTSPIVAAGMALTLGSARPQRMFDTSAGLSGIATSMLGDLGSSIFGPPKRNPVSGTALDINSNALPDANKTFATKGNLRAGTALRGLASLQAAWPGAPVGAGSSGGFMNAVKNFATSLFQNFIPQTQTNIQFRSDEGAYGMMLATDYKFSDDNGWTLGPTWVGGKSGNQNIRKKGEYPTSPFKFYAQAKNGKVTFVSISTLGSVSYSIPNIGDVGYSVSESTVEKKPGYRYEDSIGVKVDGEYQASEMMVQYKFYTDPSQAFPTKKSDPELVRKSNLKMRMLLDKIRNASDSTYTVTVPSDSRIITSDHQADSPSGYDRLLATNKRGSSPINYPLGVLKQYRDSGARLVSNDLTSADKSYNLPTAGHYDGINVLTVLDGKDKGAKKGGWATWEPYKSDFIALYFYDVVNDKYIPFRASIKGLNESGNASWEELPFIGRADKVYSYGGFNRNASFTIKIVINSLKELAPTWQRINYMATSYKPSNYTKANRGGSGTYDRFMVPPMFFLTLGDFYRDQPILIQSVVTTVPEDALWETQSELNGEGGWNYLAGLIKAPSVRYGQVPREVDLAFTITLLEKERAVIGGANFGHAPRTEDWSQFNTQIPHGTKPTKFNESMMVNVVQGS